MSYSPILILAGEPNSIFSEIFFKVINKKKFKNSIIIITSEKLLSLQMKKLKFKKKIRLIKPYNLKKQKIDNKKINLINVDFIQKKAFEKISTKSNHFLKIHSNLLLK